MVARNLGWVRRAGDDGLGKAVSGPAASRAAGPGKGGRKDEKLGAAYPQVVNAVVKKVNVRVNHRSVGSAAPIAYSFPDK
jgi:hypothetical protein